MRRATKIATFSLKTMKHTELGDKIFEKCRHIDASCLYINISPSTSQYKLQYQLYERSEEHNV